MSKKYTWQKERICSFCKKPFIPKRRISVCCSPKCNRKRYVRDNKERLKKQKKIWYQSVKERERARSKRWYQAHRESEIEKNRQYRKENRELFNWYHNKDRFNGLRRQILERDDNKCMICKTKENLCVHHIDGNGYNQFGKNGNNMPKNLITLCRSCHHKLHWWQRKNKQLKTIEDIVRTMAKVIEAGSKSQR